MLLRAEGISFQLRERWLAPCDKLLSFPFIMEDETNPSPSNLIPLAVSALAIVLGAAGLYFGLSANQRLNPIHETIEAGSSSAARIEKQIEQFEAELASLGVQGSELKKTVDRMRLYSSQSEQLAKQADVGVKANREELVKLVEILNTFTTSGVRAAPTEKPVASSGSATGPQVSSSGSTSVAGIYSIKSGDNFAKIATSQNVSLQALLDANPGVDPRRLQIGQKIQLPAN